MSQTPVVPDGPRRSGDRTVVWLPVPPEDIDDLPEDLDYVHWDGRGSYPTDPTQVDFYAPPITKDFEVLLRPLPQMEQLRVVQALSAGVDHLVPHLPPGVALCNARGVHDTSTAELALTLILASLRGIPGFVRAQDAEQWQAGLRPTLFSKTVLIIGYGSIGAAIEELLRPFGCEVVRVARTQRTSVQGVVHATSALPKLLPESDVVLLCVPLTEETRGMVGVDFLALMQDGALLVNVARGPVVDTKALLTELESGRLQAALDVTDPEPLPVGHPLWNAPGVLISPHAGAFTSALLPHVRRLLSAQLRRFARGEQLHNLAQSA
ncbi:2-hydroxyacid dehydrogenase [Streptomyces sp. NPDC055722]